MLQDVLATAMFATALIRRRRKIFEKWIIMKTKVPEKQ
jgi:hypothetical protein